MIATLHRRYALLALSALGIGCAGSSATHEGSPDAGMLTPGDGMQASDSGSTSAMALIPDDICDVTTPPLGSCISSGACQESADPAGWSIIKATCVFNDQLREGEPCSRYRVSDRCYIENNGHPTWTFHYGDHSAAQTNEQSCQESDARFCEYLPGVTAQTYAFCETECDKDKPDLSNAPECEMAFNCVEDCVQWGIGLSAPCAECVRTAPYWPMSGCGEWECQCNPPIFRVQASSECAALCK